MTKFKKPITIVLLFSFFLISTCTTNDSITGNTDRSLGKTTGVDKINSSAGVETTNPFAETMEKIFNRLSFSNQEVAGMCMVIAVLALSPWIADNEYHDDSHNDNILSKHYDFRDNYLANSDKGEVYIACYYILGQYGIENNLVNQYYKEHYELLQNSMQIAYDLQHGSNTNRILLNKKISDDLKDMLKVYRNSLNSQEIELVLNYLEADLEKYYNKPKYEIAMDFNQN